ncbi:MAG: hypothetical protein EXQ74_05505 [Thermoleophilia bacterium]|nr:hypothetical protein [Thermoleophilia bacterium]
MTARADLVRATVQLGELARLIGEATDRPVTEVEKLARQAAEISAAVMEIIPRAIAEAEDEARGGAVASDVPDDSQSDVFADDQSEPSPGA